MQQFDEFSNADKWYQLLTVVAASIGPNALGDGYKG